ncbi:hypothetical protein [Dokdonella sp.]|uniref:hypothetical protein n=1 Tax=Dokdonella sp. TaxID=2291710 RepID=UPI0026119AB0|nr:hypothetical protein [Dokdonella sp.]
MKSLVVGVALCALQACTHVPSLRQERAPVVQADSTGPVEPSPERRDFNATLAEGQIVTIDNPYGDVRLRFGGYAHALEINAVVQQPAAAAPIEWKQTRNQEHYVFSPRLPAGAKLAEEQRVDLVAFVPLGHAVIVRTESGLIESRGLRGDIDLGTVTGSIAVRGTQGRVQARTGIGNIEASFDTAPPGSRQRLETTTGDIVLAIDDHLDAELVLASSGVFATEFSLDVERLAGQEPNKRARAVVGTDDRKARIDISSRRGEIRLLRRSAFTSPGGKPVEQEQEDADSD